MIRGRCDEMVVCGMGNVGPWVFEEVLRETPSILLHLSRILTMRLVETSRPAQKKAPDSGQLITLSAALPRHDRVLVTVHLALELMEQTRRRVLFAGTRYRAILSATLAGFFLMSVSQ